MTTRQSAGAADGAARKTPQWVPAPPDAHRRWLEGKSLEELEAHVQKGRALYPDTIVRRNPAKPTGLEEVQVLLQVPLLPENLRARMLVLQEARKQLGWDKPPTEKEARAYLGDANFDNLEVVCRLSLCIFDAEPLPNGVHPPYLPAEHLAAGHPIEALSTVADKIRHYEELEGTLLHEFTEKEFHEVVAAIARCGNATPLAVIGGSALLSFVATMGARLHRFLTQQSGSPSTET